NREQVPDEKERLDEREGQRREEHRDEYVEHAFLRVLGADLNDLLAVGDARSRRAIQLDVGLNEFDGAISTGGHGLRGSPGEPVDHGAPGNQPENERSVQKRKLVDRSEER